MARPSAARSTGRRPDDRSRGGRSAPAVASPGPIPRWPGYAAALLCTLIYVLVGTRGTLNLHTSPSVHHSLTANAWLHGRLYVTDDELIRPFVIRELAQRRRQMPSDSPTNLLTEQYRALCEADWRQRAGRAGVTLSQQQLHALFAGEMERAFHDWVTLPSDPTRHYEYWPPVPVLLMLPFVLIGGPQVSDVLAGNLIGGATVLFIYLMLRALAAQWPVLRTTACTVLALTYGLGTIHLWQSCLGQVWFLTAITATLFLIIAIWMGLRAIERPAWIVGAGAALALGFLSRNTIILAAPFFAVTLWMSVRGRPDAVRRFVGWGSLFAVVLLASIAFLLAFNKVRFGNPMDFGQEHLADKGGNKRFTADFQAHGRFSPFFIPRNVFFYFLDPNLGPLGGRVHPRAGGRSFDPDGNSIFLITPVLAYLWLAWRRGADRPLGPAWLGLLALLIFMFVQTLVAAGYTGNDFRWPDRQPAVWVETAVLALLSVMLVVQCVRRKDALLLAVLCGALPGTIALMLFHGTGFYAFGPRYLLDTLPFLFLLAVFGMRGRLSWAGVLLILVSVSVNAWGTYRFQLEQF